MRNFYHTVLNRLKRAFGTSTPWLFLLSAIAIGLFGEGTSKLIDAKLTGQSVQTAVYTIFIGLFVLILIIGFFNLPHWFYTLFSPLRQTSIAIKENVPCRRGLITLVSFGKFVPARNALEYHSWAGVPNSKPILTHCWLLAGPGEGEDSSQSNAERLAEEYNAKGIKVEVWPLADADDIEEMYRAVKIIYQTAQDKYKLTTEDIIADYTGGTKSMTAGMVLAALEQEGSLQFMKPNKYKADGRADRAAGSSPRMVQVKSVLVDEAKGNGYELV